MQNSIEKVEADLAKAQSTKLQADLVARRSRCLWLAIALTLTSALIALFGYWMTALIVLVLGLISLSQYFDANGNLHEVRRRPTKTLVRDFSVLQKAESKAATGTSSTPH